MAPSYPLTCQKYNSGASGAKRVYLIQVRAFTCCVCTTGCCKHGRQPTEGCLFHTQHSLVPLGENGLVSTMLCQMKEYNSHERIIIILF